jgi:hypothetical protein
MLKFLVSLALLLGVFTVAHAQLTVEELISLRVQAKLDAVSFLQSKGYKLDSCAAPSSAEPDLSSICVFHQDKMFDQRKATSSLIVSFSKQKKNWLVYVPLQQGFSGRVMQYMKTLRAKEEAYDLIKEQKFGKKFYLENWVYDVQQSLKNLEIETIYITPVGVK